MDRRNVRAEQREAARERGLDEDRIIGLLLGLAFLEQLFQALALARNDDDRLMLFDELEHIFVEGLEPAAEALVMTEGGRESIARAFSRLLGRREAQLEGAQAAEL